MKEVFNSEVHNQRKRGFAIIVNLIMNSTAFFFILVFPTIVIERLIRKGGVDKIKWKIWILQLEH